MIRIPMASAGDKGFASRRQGPREDLGPLPPDLRSDTLEVRVECFGELLARCLGPGGPEIPKRLDPATAALLVMPEIQVGPSADRCGRVQRRAPAHDALPARTRSRRGMLRPSAGLAGTLRATRVESGGKTPGRARAPSVRGAPPPRMDP